MKAIIPWGLFILTLLLSATGCHQPGHPPEKATAPAMAVTQPDPQVNWQDSCIMSYIDQSDNELLKQAKADTSLHIQWMQDRVEDTDSASYLVYSIGHEIADENGKDLRFVSDAWLYLDRVKRKVYEYDVVNDTIGEWENRHNR